MILSPINNIINNTICSLENINIIYKHHNSIFDLIFQSLDYNFIDNKDLLGALWANTFVSNDPISFSQQDLRAIYNLHINGIVFLHNPPPKQFKKEDHLIFKQNVAKQYKVLCSPHLISGWLPSDNKWFNINYGIPDVTTDTDLKDKQNDVLILNFNNNPTIVSLYNSIKQYNSNVKIINSLPQTIDQIVNDLNNSRICIDFENLINSLFAAVCGCFIITSYDHPYLTYYKYIQNFNTINDDIKNILKDINISQLNEQKQILLQQFAFDNFIQRISALINTAIKEKFIL